MYLRKLELFNTRPYRQPTIKKFLEPSRSEKLVFEEICNLCKKIIKQIDVRSNHRDPSRTLNHMKKEYLEEFTDLFIDKKKRLLQEHL